MSKTGASNILGACTSTENSLHGSSLPAPISWARSPGLVPYQECVKAMEQHVADITAGKAPELAWLLEHPSILTAGTSAKPGDLIAPERFPVFETGRGGQYTYHGPGQRVAYVMLDLRRRKPDVRTYVELLQTCIIGALAEFSVTGFTRTGRIGIWVARPDKGPGAEDKIAAIGIRIRHWVSFHGLSINVAPDLTHYDAIVPCGITNHGVTSLKDLGVRASMNDLDQALQRSFEAVFGPTKPAAPPPLGDTNDNTHTTERQSSRASDLQES